MSSKIDKIIVILGPTASGKTELSLKLAKKFNGEIVSADSRQVYKGLDIGSGKISKKDRNSIPHYLLDVAEPNQDFNSAIYKELAVGAIKSIQKRAKTAFLVGGTGLYIQAIVDNLDFPPMKPQKELREKLEKKSLNNLFEIYKKLDKQGAKFIERKNKRRLIRAIEVCKITKKPFWSQRKKKKPIFKALQIGIKLPEPELKKRISKRVAHMIKLGLEKEAKSLFKRYGFEISSMQTIGYQEWLPYFQGKISIQGTEFLGDFQGEISKEEVIEQIKIHTLQFAKRQMTWFKKDKRIHWIENQKQAEKLIQSFVKKLL